MICGRQYCHELIATDRQSPCLECISAVLGGSREPQNGWQTQQNSLHAYVERPTRVEGQRSIHDLSVEINHTFYVDGGNGPILVHNAGRGVAASIQHNMSTVVVAEANVPGRGIQLYAAAASRPLTAEQIEFLVKAGVPRGNIVAGKLHAEMNILQALPGGGQSSKDGELLGLVETSRFHALLVRQEFKGSSRV